MLQQLAHILFVSATCMIWGVPVLLMTQSSIKRDQFWYHSLTGLLSFLFLSGCTTLSVISSWLYLAMPLKLSLLALLTVVMLLYLAFAGKLNISRYLQPEHQHIKSSVLSRLFVSISILLFVILSALLPVNGDTQIYHMQIIAWQSSYKVVPGVVNLYPRLGLGSNWFNLISFFYWPSLKNENFTYLNASFVIWFFIWLFSKWRFYFRSDGGIAGNRVMTFFYFALLLYCMFDWQLFRDSANSTNYDFPVTGLAIIVCSYFIEGIFTGQQRRKFSMLVFLFALCAISFKLSGVFLLVLIAYHFFTTRGLSRWISAVVFPVFILLPVFIKNYVVTGYPLFPSLLHFTSPEWMLPQAMAKEFYEYIILSNRFYNHTWSFIHSVDHTGLNWIPYWFEGILWKHRIIIALASLSIVFIFVKTKLLVNHNALRWVIVCLLIMLLGWFFTAPDPGRFGYGILLCTALLTVGITIHRYLSASYYMPAMLLTLAMMIYYTIRKSAPMAEKPSTILYPISFKVPPYQLVSAGTIALKLPARIDDNNDCRCYYTPLPCITQRNPYLHARGLSIEDGFRMEQPDTAYITKYLY